MCGYFSNHTIHIQTGVHSPTSSGVGNDTHQTTSQSGPTAVGAGGPFLPRAYTYIHFYHRRLRGLSHDELPSLERGTRCRISARFIAPGHETPRARRGVLLGRGAAVRALLATCAPSPCASKVLRKPEAFPLQGLGSPKAEHVQGVASVGRAGPGEVLQIIFGSGGPESVLRQSVCTEWKNGCFGDRASSNSCTMVPHLSLIHI